MNKYRISIIIPIYNVEPYIEECIQSVVCQTRTEGLECILIDDCGTDNSMKIAEQFVASYKGNIDFHILHHEHNKGLSAARNTGIRAANGEYVYLLDSDDTITPDCLDYMWGYVEKYGKVDLVQGSFYSKEEEKEKINEYPISEFSADQLYIKTSLLNYYGDIIASANKLIKEELIYKYDLYFKEGIIHEDNYWTFFLAKSVTSMCFCKKRTYYHRYNQSSITGNVNVEKETKAYHTIVKELCSNIDPFLPGIQKEYILNNLITSINGGYYILENGQNALVEYVCKTYTYFEKLLFHLYLTLNNSFLKNKILHLLIRVFKS